MVKSVNRNRHVNRLYCSFQQNFQGAALEVKMHLIQNDIFWAYGYKELKKQLIIFLPVKTNKNESRYTL